MHGTETQKPEIRPGRNRFMPIGKMLSDGKEIGSALQKASVIAVVGLSPEPWRDAHRVARYLQTAGYRILPVRPGAVEILGEKAYERLEDIPISIDIVDIFRRSDQVLAHALEALKLSPAPSLFWMQEGVSCDRSATQLTAAGIDVIMDRCIMVDHGRFVKKNRV